MPLTNAERTALKTILDDTDLDGIIDAFDPATNADKAYIKAQVQAARDQLFAERALISTRAQQQFNNATNRLALLDGLLAKFP